MNYNFYKDLSVELQKKYDLMLETNYILLRCDEWTFIETDESGRDSVSVSWIQSMQPSLDLFGLDDKSYPQGSLSANRHYYEVLRSYLGGRFPSTEEFNYLREALKNLITLRRDDSVTNKSLLFGSCFKVIKSSGSRDPQKYRSVDVNLRHSATALWILCEESVNGFSNSLQNSLYAFFDRIETYLSNKEDWEKDNYKHLTLASTINTFNTIIKKSLHSGLTERAVQVKSKCEVAIYSSDCLKQELDGEYRWSIPPMNRSKLAKYEYYLNAFVLTQVPELLHDLRAQSIVRGMVKNKVPSTFGIGIPIHKLTTFSNREEAIPDFGATASVLFLLWYSLNNNVGNSKWLKYCRDNFNWLLEFCLNTYDKKEFYILPHSENNTKILLMPRFNFENSRFKEIEQFIFDLKKAINTEMEQHRRKLYKLLGKLRAPKDLEHLADILGTWEITKYWRKQKRWAFDGNLSKLGEFLGGFVVGTLRAIGSPS